MDIKIRKATIKDLAKIQDLSQKLFSFETEFTNEYNQNWTYSNIGKRFLRGRINSNRAIVLVAEAGEKVIAYILSYVKSLAYRENNPIAVLENMFVEKEFRRRGVGRKLVDETLNLLKKRKVKRIRVGAMSRNDKAIDFYNKMGFTPFNLYLERNI